VKLVVREAESEALQAEAGTWPRWVTSAVAGVEVRRAARRLEDEPALRERAERVLGTCALLSVDEVVLEKAAVLAPARLRTLDAIHLASALGLGEDLGAFAAYDHGLLEAAQTVGLPVISPRSSAT
jgi:predicted nucleic acid-binding protein